MLPSFRLRALLSLLLLALATHLATAQTGWQQIYSSKHPQWCNKALLQPDGGVLFVGYDMLKSSSATQPAPRRLLLLCTDAHGRKLWEQTQPLAGLPGFLLYDACQNAQGELLISLVSDFPLQGGLYPNYLVQVKPNGPIRWTRDFRGTRRTVKALAPDDSNDGFVVGVNNYTGNDAALLYLNLDGTQRQLLPLTGDLGALLAQPGGTLVGAGRKVFFMSYDWVRGAETTLPSGSNASMLLDLGNNSFLVYSGQTHRFTLGSDVLQWSRSIYTGEGTLVPQSWAYQPASKEVLIKGFAMRSSHTSSTCLALLDAGDGTDLRNAKKLADDGPGGTVASVLPGPAPGTFLMAGYVPGGLFLQLGPYGELQMAKPSPLTAWPNPIANGQLLLVSNAFALANPLYLYDLSGHLLRSWPAAPTGPAAISLQGVPPGTYLLVGTDGQGKTGRTRIYHR